MGPAPREAETTVTKNRNRKDAIRALADAQGISVQAATKLYDEQRAAPDAGRQAAEPGWRYAWKVRTTIDLWNETHAAFGATSRDADPIRWQALLDSRALIWQDVAAGLRKAADGLALADEVRELLRIASTGCMYAQILDQEDAARTRYRHRIPTLFPAQDKARLHLQTCDACGRPWQVDPEGACPRCPAIVWGPSPKNAEEAEQLRANGAGGEPVSREALLADPMASLREDDE